MTRGTLRPNMPWYTELILMAVLSGLGALYVTYTTNDRVDAQRLSVVETKQDGMDKRLDRMENKIDHIIEGVMGERPQPRGDKP